MKRRSVFLIVLIVVIAMFGVVKAAAHGGDITGYPFQLKRVDLSGYVIETNYTLGVNTGNKFDQTYLPGGKFSAVCVSGPFAPCAGGGNYTAMPVGEKQLMVTWYDDAGALSDVFVFNFDSHVVSDVAPGSSLPGSLGTVRILHRGAARIP
jgi:hypothetical protein